MRRFSNSSSSSSSSHSSSSESGQRFHIVENENQFKWDFPPDLAFYANTQFEKCISEKSLHDAICEVHPILNKLNQAKKMDDFLKRSIERE